MPPFAFAAAEARIGRAIVARLCNARLGVEGGILIDGILTRAATASPVGSVGMRARDISFHCHHEAEAGQLADGLVVSLYTADNPNVPQGSYRVRGEPALSHETGLLAVELEAAS